MKIYSESRVPLNFSTMVVSSHFTHKKMLNSFRVFCETRRMLHQEVYQHNEISTSEIKDGSRLQQKGGLLHLYDALTLYQTTNFKLFQTERASR